MKKKNKKFQELFINEKKNIYSTDLKKKIHECIDMNYFYFNDYVM